MRAYPLLIAEANAQALGINLGSRFFELHRALGVRRLLPRRISHRVRYVLNEDQMSRVRTEVRHRVPYAVSNEELEEDAGDVEHVSLKSAQRFSTIRLNHSLPHDRQRIDGH